MSNEWAIRAANPDAFGESEKKLWNEVEPKIRALFEELKKNKRIETVYTPAEYRHLKSIFERVDLASRVHNVLIHIPDIPDRAQKFIDANRETGIDEPIYGEMYLQAALFLDLVNTELFKLLILFHIKGTSTDYLVSKFPTTMQKFAPNSWKDLKRYVDNDFRNAIGHATFSVRNKKVVIYRDAKLVPLEAMDLAEFMMRLKRQNVLFQCLVNVIAELKRNSWFTHASVPFKPM